MAKVVARKDEDIESLLRRFKKQIIKDEILLECRKRESFKKKALKRKEKSELARRKASKNYNPKI